MSFNISEKDLPAILNIPQFLETFSKIDCYILEKEKQIKDLDLRILNENVEFVQMNQEYIELEAILKKMQAEEEALNMEIKENEQKELQKKEFYTKLLENNFENKLRIVENEKPYPEDKYFTVEWTLPPRKEDLNKGPIVLFVMFEIETRKIVKMNDNKGKILDKENIDWGIFQMNDRRNRNALLLEIYKEYSPY